MTDWLRIPAKSGWTLYRFNETIHTACNTSLSSFQPGEYWSSGVRRSSQWCGFWQSRLKLPASHGCRASRRQTRGNVPAMDQRLHPKKECFSINFYECIWHQKKKELEREEWRLPREVESRLGMLLNPTFSISQTALCSWINKIWNVDSPAQLFLTSPEIGIPFSSCSRSPSPEIFSFPSLNVLTLLIPVASFPSITLASLQPYQ